MVHNPKLRWIYNENIWRQISNVTYVERDKYRTLRMSNATKVERDFRRTRQIPNATNVERDLYRTRQMLNATYVEPSSTFVAFDICRVRNLSRSR